MMVIDSTHKALTQRQRRLLCIIGMYLLLLALIALPDLISPSGYSVAVQDDFYYDEICHDLDGTDFYQASAVVYKPFGNNQYYYDNCYDYEYLNEYLCSKTQPVAKRMKCPDDMICYQGRCT